MKRADTLAVAANGGRLVPPGWVVLCGVAVAVLATVVALAAFVRWPGQVVVVIFFLAGIARKSP